MSDKSTWWSVTAFDDEILLLEGTEFPEFVAKVHGGKEECPTTGKVHFQGAVQCRRQVRFTSLKKWLPKAHWEPAKNIAALKQYVMKADTAVGDKTSTENVAPMITMEYVMKVLADVWDNSKVIEYMEKDKAMDLKDALKYAYWEAVNDIFYKRPEFRRNCQLFARADTLTLWLNTRLTWIKLKEEESGYSITPDSPKGYSGLPEIISNLLVQPDASQTQVCPEEEDDSS